MIKIAEKEQIVLDREYLEELKRKASLFEEILSFLEDEYLGYLMEKTEKEKNIPLPKAKKILK
jgi:predicted house-cleaning noncanonical NTP pyrophosphatase (MazG superfamily)